MNHQKIIEKSFADIPHMLVKGKSYHSPLPPEIKDWYCYLQDGGHSVLSIVKAHSMKAFVPSIDPCNYLVPISVKTVLRSYEIKNGFVLVDVEYDYGFGVIQDDEDWEF